MLVRILLPAHVKPLGTDKAGESADADTAVGVTTSIRKLRKLIHDNCEHMTKFAQLRVCPKIAIKSQVRGVDCPLSMQ